MTTAYETHQMEHMAQGYSDVSDEQMIGRLFADVRKFSFTHDPQSGLATVFATGRHGPVALTQFGEETMAGFLFRALTKLQTPKDAPRCAYCRLPLLTLRDLQAGAHRKPVGSTEPYSCEDRALEHATEPSPW